MHILPWVYSIMYRFSVFMLKLRSDNFLTKLLNENDAAAWYITRFGISFHLYILDYAQW